MLEHLHPFNISSILELFNQNFHSRKFSTCLALCNCNSTLILKPNKNPKQAASYRLVSLTSTLCKLLEKIVNNRLMWFLESGGHITTVQSDFRTNRSTIENLVLFDTDLRRALANKLHTIAIFFDIQQTYDTAWRCGLFSSLHEMGLRGNLHTLLQNFFDIGRSKLGSAQRCHNRWNTMRGYLKAVC